MSGRGNCYDNSIVETFFKTLKSELVWRTVFLTRAEARNALARYIDGFYNPLRRHSALDFISPAQFERRAASQTALHQNEASPRCHEPHHAQAGGSPKPTSHFVNSQQAVDKLRPGLTYHRSRGIPPAGLVLRRASPAPLAAYSGANHRYKKTSGGQ
jgi:hypothetical protein